MREPKLTREGRCYIADTRMREGPPAEHWTLCSCGQLLKADTANDLSILWGEHAGVPQVHGRVVVPIETAFHRQGLARITSRV